NFNNLVEAQLKARQNFIIPLWHPQYLHHMFDIFPLEEPKGLLRGKDLATPILLKQAATFFSENDLDILSSIRIGNDAVSYIEYSFYKYKLSAKEAAKRWIQQNYGSVESYICMLEGNV
ncbi:glycine betaine ABC transporter substrate-binding protein, partial [Chryseobacterium sp. OSA05B]|uniref:glycine betaine ABC transporter substrate-binding protein n=1 Tax=Chryseobacterium sp. OSA05B TaxID=2862650 RepID=UPI001CBCA273